MKQLAILGAAGTIGQLTRKKILERTNLSLVLYARRAKERLQSADPERETIIDGDFLDLGRLVHAFQGCQYVCLTDIHDSRATLRVIEAMKLAGVKKLISIAPERNLCQPEALKQLATSSDLSLSQKTHQLLLQQKNRLMSYHLIAGSELIVSFVHLPSEKERMAKRNAWQKAIADEILAIFHGCAA